MNDDLPGKLANCRGKGYVIAPAGYGKTHLIALAVKASTQRQLILTHTFAGVNSIKTKMNLLRVPSSKYQIDTIASWALRFCLYYPKTSQWFSEHPVGGEWGQLYEACRYLLDKQFVKRVIKNSYAGVYVDEYQDCSESQNALIFSISNILPCRILGDPMQAIFDFAEKPVDWMKSIYPYYELLGVLAIPWRWRLSGATDLGDWLDNARRSLIKGEQINLSSALPKSVRKESIDLMDFSNPKRLSFLYGFLKNDDSVIGIYSGSSQGKNKSHQLAKSLAGKFSSIEEVEGKDLFAFIKKLETSETPKDKLLHAVDFARKCFSGVDKILSAGTKRGEYAKTSKATKYPHLVASANSYLAEASSENLKSLLSNLRDSPEISTCRRDLFNRLMNVLRKHCQESNFTLSEAAKLYQRDFRHSGRPIKHSKLIGTTLLVKGLEYQHAVIFEADTLNPKELYVALTRGAKTLTIVTTKSAIPT